jgi:hypothetical protein
LVQEFEVAPGSILDFVWGPVRQHWVLKDLVRNSLHVLQKFLIQSILCSDWHTS